AERIAFDASGGDEDLVEHAVKTMGSAFRMVEKDLAAALVSDKSITEGPQRNMFATRMHLRASPRILARINKHLKAIEDIITSEVAGKQKESPSDQHLSLTMALLPLRGRGQNKTSKGE
ncbi:MAG: hypothetical protein ABFS42_12355, partial [Candidatus Krumholzibacteriota bacterium]